MLSDTHYTILNKNDTFAVLLVIMSPNGILHLKMEDPYFVGFWPSERRGPDPLTVDPLVHRGCFIRITNNTNTGVFRFPYIRLIITSPHYLCRSLGPFSPFGPFGSWLLHTRTFNNVLISIVIYTVRQLQHDVTRSWRCNLKPTFVIAIISDNNLSDRDNPMEVCFLHVID